MKIFFTHILSRRPQLKSFNFCQTEQELLIVWRIWHMIFFGRYGTQGIWILTFLARMNSQFTYYVQHVGHVRCHEISGTQGICNH